jgi:hypothetical protein
MAIGISRGGALPLPPTKHFIKNMRKEFMDEIIPIAFHIP